MEAIYVTYVDDEHVDNHDYDDNTDDDHDNNNDLYARACNARVNTSIHIYIYTRGIPSIFMDVYKVLTSFYRYF